jgi:uncharacterized protein YtpQ (UPF0354 family)
VPLFGRKKDDRAASADWRKRVAAPALSPRTLTEIVAELLRARGIAVEITADLTLSHARSEPQTQLSHLDNLLAMCRGASAQERVALIEQRVASEIEIIAMAAAGTAAKDLGSIRPLIRPESYRAELASPPPHRQLAGDLWVFYGYDRPNSVAILTERDREDANLSLEELDALAIRNLRRAMTDVKIDGTPSAREVSAGGDYESSLLLLDELWAAQAVEWPKGVIAVAPAIDALYVADAGDPVGVEIILGSAHDVFEGGRGLSKTMLRWTGSGWVVYDGPGSGQDLGIQNPEQIDQVAGRDGNWSVVMIQTRPWEPHALRIDQLRRKASVYAAWIAGGGLAQGFPESKGAPTSVVLAHSEPLPAAIEAALAQIKRDLGARGIGFKTFAAYAVPAS